MSGPDRLLINPTNEELDHALAEVAGVINQDRDSRLLEWPPADFAEYQQLRLRPDGWREWLLHRDDSRPDPSDVLLTAWWTDAVGQKHHRIVGESAATWTEEGWHPLRIRRPPTLVPLALVHPERVAVRTIGTQLDAVVCCPCGVIGMPAELGWMGTCCGPCHDRRLEGETEPPRPGNQAPMSVAWSANLETVVMLGFDAAGRYVLHVQDVPSNRERGTHTGLFLGNLALSPDGNLLALGGWRHDVSHGQVVVWNLANEETRPLIERTSHDVWSLAFSPDGQTLAVAIAREGIRLIDPATSKLKRTLGEYFGCHDGVAFHPNGRLIAAATNRPSSLGSLFDHSCGYAVGLWDATTGALLEHFEVHCYVPKLAFSPDGRFLAVWAGANLDPDVVVWDVENRRRHLHLSEPTAAGASVFFTPDSRFLGCYTRHTGTLCLWDLINGERRVTLQWAGDPPSGMKFTHSGDLLVARKMGEPLECWPRSLLGLDQESKPPRSTGGGQ